MDVVIMLITVLQFIGEKSIPIHRRANMTRAVLHINSGKTTYSFISS